MVLRCARLILIVIIIIVIKLKKLQTKFELNQIKFKRIYEGKEKDVL